MVRHNNILQTEMNTEIQTYNNGQSTVDKEICDLLATTINSELTEAECKIWHAHPVWFINGNPIVGYSKQKSRQIQWDYKNIVKRKGRLERLK